jgi:hypothetical protein
MSDKREQDPRHDEFVIHEFHRNAILDEEGVSLVVVEQFVHHRLPFLQQVKGEMDAGKTLTDGELELMTRIVTLAHDVNKLAFLHPNLQELIARIIDLVHDITGEALQNETNGSGE